MNKYELLTNVTTDEKATILDACQTINSVYRKSYDWHYYDWSENVTWLKEHQMLFDTYLQEWQIYNCTDELSTQYDQTVKQLIMLSLLMVEKMLRDLE